MNVLLIEDESETSEAIASYLHLQGITAFAATSLSQAQTLMQTERMDVIVLDIELPDGNGLHWLRQNADCLSQAGLIIVSAHHDESMRLQGLELGADAFLRKPLAVRELFLQIENLAARIQPSKLSQLAPDQWCLDLCQWYLISPSGQKVSLTLSEIQFFKALAESPHEPVSRSRIIACFNVNPLHYDHRRLETLVRRLRQKAQNALSDYELPLTTVRGVGYAFQDKLSVKQE